MRTEAEIRAASPSPVAGEEEIVEAAALAHRTERDRRFGRDPMPLDWWRRQSGWEHEVSAMRVALDVARAARASADAEVAEAGKEAVSWRCFHCDEAFTDREAAAAHFGYSECSDPACRVDGGLAVAYRELEARWSRCLNECCEDTKAYHAKESERRAALVREEQRGYDKGVSDMRAEIAELRASLAKAEEVLRSARGFIERELECREASYLNATGVPDNEEDGQYISEAKEALADIDARIAELTPDLVETK